MYLITWNNFYLTPNKNVSNRGSSVSRGTHYVAHNLFIVYSLMSYQGHYHLFNWCPIFLTMVIIAFPRQIQHCITKYNLDWDSLKRARKIRHFRSWWRWDQVTFPGKKSPCLTVSFILLRTQQNLTYLKLKNHCHLRSVNKELLHISAMCKLSLSTTTANRSFNNVKNTSCAKTSDHCAQKPRNDWNSYLWKMRGKNRSDLAAVRGGESWKNSTISTRFFYY
jgi:hypothetical protein